MSERKQIPQVGAPDPELKTSPIAWDTDGDTEALREDVEGPMCYFNGACFGHDTHVQAGHTRLRCDNGIWVPAGTPAD